MRKYPVYAIMALVFIGIIKLLQVTAFDSEQYAKNKESSFSSYSDKTEMTPKKQTKKPEGYNLKETTKGDSTSFESPDLSDETVENAANPIEPNVQEVSTSNGEDESFSNESRASYESYADLKNLYLAPKIANLPPGQLREDVVIRYYRHKKDEDKVFSLKELGYYIHEKEATETAGLGSNVIYYGEGVNIEDIQIVAYSLLEAGIPIKAISQTQFTWKVNSIEIGTDTLLLEVANLTEQEIKNFVK